MSEATITSTDSTSGAAPGLRPAAILLVALSLSIGWGVRGNWGHEYGAMIPGALAAMAAVIVSGRLDWRRRVAYFAMFGALGWSFGGSISYMQVIAYTHSGDAYSVPYGFACLFVIGFLWGAVGGAGTVAPAALDRERLTELFPPLLAVFAAWFAQDVWLWLAERGAGADAGWLAVQSRQLAEYLQERSMAQYDTDWLAALLAIVAVLLLAGVRRRICRASRLVLYMAVGWWLGFSVLVLGLGLRMTPPRGDNWAGALGMVAGMFLYLQRERLFVVSYGALIVGLFGGLGFSGAAFIKLIAIRSGYDTNWHSVLEQTYGLINGLGVAIAMGLLATRTTERTDSPPARRWTEPLAIAFVLLLVTWVNIRKNVESIWLKNHVIPETMHGLSAYQWLSIAYAAVAVVLLILLLSHYLGRRIPLIPADWLGRSQLFYAIFLWWIVLGNLSRYLPFAEQRLITEGVIHLNACLCTLLALLWPSNLRAVLPAAMAALPLRKIAIAGVIGTVLLVAVETAVTQAIWQGEHTGDKHARKHIRFGPNRTTEQR